MRKKFTGSVILAWILISVSTLAVSSTNIDGEAAGNRDERRDTRQGARTDARESQQYLPPTQSAPTPAPSTATQLEQRAPGQSQSAAPDAGRRQGRMSPEERRALRQQIDRAGHELYPPVR